MLSYCTLGKPTSKHHLMTPSIALYASFIPNKDSHVFTSPSQKDIRPFEKPPDLADRARHLTVLVAFKVIHYNAAMAVSHWPRAMSFFDDMVQAHLESPGWVVVGGAIQGWDGLKMKTVKKMPRSGIGEG